MIISRKKFEAAIEQARMEVEKDHYTQRRFSELWDRTNDLDKRIAHLERICHADMFEPTLVIPSEKR